VSPLRGLWKNVLAASLSRPLLHDNIQDMTALIYRTPEVVTCAVDHQKDLITQVRMTVAPKWVPLKLTMVSPSP
jgi:hypothetical protein